MSPRQTAKSLKTEKDLTDYRQVLTKLTVEAALSAELDDHLGYDKPEVTSSSEQVRIIKAKVTVVFEHELTIGHGRWVNIQGTEAKL